MEIKLTKCDHCGKEHPKKDRFLSFGDDTQTVYLRLPGVKNPKAPQEVRETKYADLCNLECLEAFLAAYKAKARVV